MTNASRPSVAQIIEDYGQCLELVPMDPHFHGISVGLYMKNGVCTLWSYSGKPGLEERILAIRDQFVALGGLTPIEGTHSQVKFLCGDLHLRALRFLLAQAVGKSPDFSPEGDGLSIRDTRTKLTLNVSGIQTPDRYVYALSATGEAPSIPARLRMVVAGFVRYGEMEKVGDAEIAFPCGQRHDRLMGILMPYSRNISAVEDMMEADAMRGQMTTNTLGFSAT
jgi:hypothetical protein